MHRAITHGRDPAHSAQPARPERGTLSLWFTAAAVSWTALASAGLLGPAEACTFVVIAVATLTASALGVRRYRPAPRWPWIGLAAALVLFLVGGGVRQAVGSYGDLSPGRNLVPDFIVVPGYAVVAVSIAGFIRARSGRHRHDLDALLDSAVVALAALALAWVHLISPALRHEAATLGVRLSLAIYPPLSVFLAAMTVRVSFTAGARSSAAQRLFLAMMCFMVLGDTVQTFGDSHLADIPKDLADLPYAFAFIAFGATCLHPSMRTLAHPVPSDETSPVRRRLVLIVASLAVPAVLTQLRTDANGDERLVLGAVVVLLTLAAAWRVARAVHQQAASQALLRYQATHDELTGLPNRAMLLEHIERARSGIARGERAAILFLDLDRFKAVNDTSGHSAGDAFLIAVAHRLRNTLDPADVVARIGGDEFVVVLRSVPDGAGAMARAERLRRAFEQPFEVQGLELYSTVSIGMVLLEADEREAADALLQNADTAMYEVKAAGGDGVAVFDAAMRDTLRERLQLERDLRHALEHGELQVYYQPIVSLAGERLEGFEALIRWAHPTRGLVPPVLFIPIAEESGLIVDIGTWVLHEAMRQLGSWRTNGTVGSGIYVAVNLSARQLRDPHLLDEVHGALDAARLPPEALCLELTESLLMEDPDAAIAVLEQIRAQRVKLSIDDFGTGYSSLSYLRRLPVDTVKIDKSFVDGLGRHDSAEATLVAAIVAMAGALRMATVAEGVERDEQATVLREMGATRAQGYLYGRPYPADVIPAAVDKLRHGAPHLQRRGSPVPGAAPVAAGPAAPPTIEATIPGS
ncbi:MAG: EAL domain-containing protein [Acidimicrobiales bacterium]